MQQEKNIWLKINKKIKIIIDEKRKVSEFIVDFFQIPISDNMPFGRSPNTDTHIAMKSREFNSPSPDKQCFALEHTANNEKTNIEENTIGIIKQYVKKVFVLKMQAQIATT